MWDSRRDSTGMQVLRGRLRRRGSNVTQVIVIRMLNMANLEPEVVVYILQTPFSSGVIHVTP